MNDLELRILRFIDKETWGEFKPKMIPMPQGNRFKTKGVSQRVKVRWNTIKYNPEGKNRFQVKAHTFEKAIYTLKLNKLITSRTKCQRLEGLTCTLLGHNTAKRQ